MLRLGDGAPPWARDALGRHAAISAAMGFAANGEEALLSLRAVSSDFGYAELARASGARLPACLPPCLPAFLAVASPRLGRNASGDTERLARGTPFWGVTSRALVF